MARCTVTLTFENKEDRESFVGWFLDGGGEYEWNEGREKNDKLPWLQTDPPDGQADFDPHTRKNYRIFCNRPKEAT